MSGASGERVGMVIIRCWTEDDGPDGFRASVTLVPDLATGESDERYFAEPEAALDAVRTLLASVSPS